MKRYLVTVGSTGSLKGILQIFRGGAEIASLDMTNRGVGQQELLELFERILNEEENRNTIGYAMTGSIYKETETWEK